MIIKYDRKYDRKYDKKYDKKKYKTIYNTYNNYYYRFITNPLPVPSFIHWHLFNTRSHLYMFKVIGPSIIH